MQTAEEKAANTYKDLKKNNFEIIQYSKEHKKALSSKEKYSFLLDLYSKVGDLYFPWKQLVIIIQIAFNCYQKIDFDLQKFTEEINLGLVKMGHSCNLNDIKCTIGYLEQLRKSGKLYRIGTFEF